jgi:uncharacterized protein (DUF433 family)
MQAFDAQPPPLVFDHGVIRVRGTRVSLESIVYAFDRGASAEEIVDGYPTLDLAAVYGTLAYVLQNRDDVDRYLARRRVEAEKLRAEVEMRFPQVGLRARLLVRRAARPGVQRFSGRSVQETSRR